MRFDTFMEEILNGKLLFLYSETVGFVKIYELQP